MKRVRAFASILAVLVTSIGLFLGVQFFANNYLNAHNERVPRPEVSCPQRGVAHQVSITNGVVMPAHTTAALCDTLTVTNNDGQVRDLAFGAHDHHQSYDGQTENLIKQGEQVTVVLNKAGDYMFHDHLQDETKGTFEVSAHN